MRNRGFSLLEVMIAMAVVSLTLLSLLSLINSSGRVQDEAGERTTAYNAARRVVEELRSTPLAEIYARYNTSTLDNPKTGTSPGDTFKVDDLPKGHGGGLQGKIRFPEGKGGLSEDPADDELAGQLGMPKDLNRDGDLTDTGLTAYAILPIKVEVEWIRPGGKISKVQVVTLIAER